MMIIVGIIFIAGWAFDFVEEVDFWTCSNTGFAVGEFCAVGVESNRALWIGPLKSFGFRESK